MKANCLILLVIAALLFPVTSFAKDCGGYFFGYTIKKDVVEIYFEGQFGITGDTPWKSCKVARDEWGNAILAMINGVGAMDANDGKLAIITTEDCDENNQYWKGPEAWCGHVAVRPDAPRPPHN